MSAETYFKSAAANLRRAAQEKRHEIDKIKQDFSNREKTMHERIEKLKQDKHYKEASTTSKDVDNHTRVELTRQAQEDITAISDTQHAYNRDRSNMDQAIKDKQREIAEIERQASKLETRR